MYCTIGKRKNKQFCVKEIKKVVLSVNLLKNYQDRVEIWMSHMIGSVYDWRSVMGKNKQGVWEILTKYRNET